MGTTVSSTAGFRPPSTPSNAATAANGTAASVAPRPGPYSDRVLREPHVPVALPCSHPSGAMGEGIFSPGGRPMPLSPVASYNTAAPHQSLLLAHHDPQTRDPHFSAVHPTNSSSGITPHQQEQRGVSQLQHAVTAVTSGGPVNQTLAHRSPSGGVMQGTSHVPVPLNPTGNGILIGNQGALEKRGPVEFNHAISYVNKIKVSSPFPSRQRFFLSSRTRTHTPSNVHIHTSQI